MAVTAYHIKAQRDGESRVDRKGALTEINNRKFVVRYVVHTNNLTDGPGLILATAGLPQVGESYTGAAETDAAATCVNVRVHATDSPYLWELEAEYDTDRLVSLVLDNPLNIPPEIQWSFAKYERVMVRDILGVPLVNSSKEWFDPPVVAEDSRPVLTITRNESSFNPSLAVTYQDAVNADIFAGAAPRVAKINSFTGVKQIDAGAQYWKVTYEIEFRRETFDVFVLDQGYRDTDRRLFLDPLTAQPMSNPTLMNGQGRRLTDAVTGLVAPIGPGDTTIIIGDTTKFPPGPAVTPHWYYEIRVDAEVMRVIGGFNTLTWSVIRGYAGTVPAWHAAAAKVYLEPYFLRFLPHKVLAFAPLNLPVV